VTLDLAALRAWIGRRESLEDVCDPRRVADLAAALDWERAPTPGERLPPGWHWIFFNPMARASVLGADGHPRRGGFLPPVALPRRMWAGGRLSFRDAIAIGAPLRRYSEILSVDAKDGRSGTMVFVVVRHRIFANDSLALEEEHDIVYRAPPVAGAPSAGAEPAPDGAAWRRRIAPDPVLLFRYSALTGNGHRIHYDQPYATNVESYPGLVFHGPLTATLLMDLAERGADRPLARFVFRNRAPLFDVAPFTIAGAPRNEGKAARLWAATPEGGLATDAEAEFAA
jgi:3-methylfumaryl-CoA hydratase